MLLLTFPPMNMRGRLFRVSSRIWPTSPSTGATMMPLARFSMRVFTLEISNSFRRFVSQRKTMNPRRLASASRPLKISA